MEIKVVLFGMLRQRLARESKGRLMISLPDGSTVNDLLTRLDIQTAVICTLNGQFERDLETRLSDGDEVQFIQPIGGGISN